MSRPHRTFEVAFDFGLIDSPIWLIFKLAYFDFVHPIYPILEKGDFEQRVHPSQLQHSLAASVPFFTLYHTVLALGCQYEEGGTFDPGKGMSWKLFQVALGQILEIITPKERLVHVQVSQECPFDGSALTQSRRLHAW